jgi:hypothetical protein
MALIILCTTLCFLPLAKEVTFEVSVVVVGRCWLGFAGRWRRPVVARLAVEVRSVGALAVAGTVIS